MANRPDRALKSGGPPGRGALWARSPRTRSSLEESGVCNRRQADQGAGRGPGGPPHSYRWILALALAALGVSCRSGPPPAIDPGVAARVPTDAVALAGVNLDRLRASPLRQRLPPAALAFLEPLRDADSLLFASNGADYLFFASGAFRQPPAGTTLLAPGLAAAGSPAWLRAAGARRQSPSEVPSPLWQHSQPLAAAGEIWIAVAGSANLPVTGNAENLNRLLHTTQYSTLSLRLANSMELAVVGMCATPESARRLEETVRAMFTLGAAASSRQPALAGLLKRVRVSREDRAVHLNLSAAPADIDQLLKLF